MGESVEDSPHFISLLIQGALPHALCKPICFLLLDFVKIQHLTAIKPLIPLVDLSMCYKLPVVMRQRMMPELKTELSTLCPGALILSNLERVS